MQGLPFSKTSDDRHYKYAKWILEKGARVLTSVSKWVCTETNVTLLELYNDNESHMLNGRGWSA